MTLKYDNAANQFLFLRVFLRAIGRYVSVISSEMVTVLNYN